VNNQVTYNVPNDVSEGIYLSELYLDNVGYAGSFE